MAEEGVTPNKEVDDEEEEEEQSSDDRQTLDDLTDLTDSTTPLDEVDEQGAGDDTLEWEEPAASQSLSTIHTGSRPTDAELMANLVPQGDTIIEQGEIVPPEETVGAELPEVDAELPETEPDPEPVPEAVVDAAPPPPSEEEVVEEVPEEEPVPEEEAAPEPVQFAEAPAAPAAAVEPEPEEEDVDVEDAVGDEDTGIPLEIDPGTATTLTIADVPSGATLNYVDGTGATQEIVIADGVAELTLDQLNGLTILPAEDSATDFSLTVTATATETTTGDTSTTTSTVNVTVDGVADAPDLSVTLGSDTETGGGVSPVGCWNVDETSGSTFYDSIGDNDGAMHGSFDKDDSGVFGTTSAEFRPGSSNEYIEVDHSDALKPDSGALTMWFNADDVSGRNALASSDSSGYDTGGHFSLFVENGSIRLRMQSTNDQTDFTAGSVSTNEWNQVTVTWGDDGARIYLNGELVGSDSSWTDGLGGNDNPWTFGANQWASGNNVADSLQDYFDGHMDDIAIYDQQLTADQIADLYSDGVTDMMDADDSSIEYPLTITTALADTDGSESLSITIDGVPDGAVLSAGTDIGDGSWTLGTDDLDGLTVTVPSGSDDFMLNVSATATDEGGDTRTATQLVQVDAGTTGTDGAETLTGSSGDDVISGEGVADDIDAGGGDDTVMGGAGADTIDSGAGDDHIMGAEGDDLFIFGSGDGSDYFNGGDGWSDTVQLEGVDGGTGGDAGWTLQVDEGTGVEFDAEASGSIVLADGSELTFDNVEELEW